jgi:hypothetical protein
MTDFSAVRLDRSKPHGTVHGVIEDGIHYHQDGLPFDAHGRLIVDRLSPDQLAFAERKGRRSARANARGGGQNRHDAGKDAPAEAGDVDLAAWLRGEGKYLFDEVRGAIRKRYSRDVASIGDAVEFLTQELVPPLVAIDAVARRLAPP